MGFTEGRSGPGGFQKRQPWKPDLGEVGGQVGRASLQNGRRAGAACLGAGKEGRLGQEQAGLAFHNLGAAGRGVGQGVGGAALSAGRRGRLLRAQGLPLRHLSLRQRSAGPTGRRGHNCCSIFLDLALSPVYCSGGQFTLIADRRPLGVRVG